MLTVSVIGKRTTHYNGDFDERPHGQGDAKYHDQSTYCGNFKDGLPHDSGVLTTSAGSYKGNWCQGLAEGEGAYQSSEQKYRGQWQRGLPHGQGRYRSKTQCYNGHWRDGKMHGFGVLLDSDGKKYCGSFNNNVRQGMILRYENEQISLINFIDGTIYSQEHSVDLAEDADITTGYEKGMAKISTALKSRKMRLLPVVNIVTSDATAKTIMSEASGATVPTVETTIPIVQLPASSTVAPIEVISEPIVTIPTKSSAELPLLPLLDTTVASILAATNVKTSPERNNSASIAQALAKVSNSVTSPERNKVAVTVPPTTNATTSPERNKVPVTVPPVTGVTTSPTRNAVTDVINSAPKVQPVTTSPTRNAVTAVPSPTSITPTNKVLPEAALIAIANLNSSSLTRPTAQLRPANIIAVPQSSSTLVSQSRSPSALVSQALASLLQSSPVPSVTSVTQSSSSPAKKSARSAEDDTAEAILQSARNKKRKVVTDGNGRETIIDPVIDAQHFLARLQLHFYFHGTEVLFNVVPAEVMARLYCNFADCPDRAAAIMLVAPERKRPCSLPYNFTTVGRKSITCHVTILGPQGQEYCSRSFKYVRHLNQGNTFHSPSFIDKCIPDEEAKRLTEETMNYGGTKRD